MQSVLGRAVLAATLLAAGGVASANEFRFVCNDNPSVACSPRNTTATGNLARDVAIAEGAVVGDAILIIKNSQLTGSSTQLVREYEVISAPVTTAANLQDFGWWTDTYDYALPPPPGLRGDSPGESWDLNHYYPGWIWRHL